MHVHVVICLLGCLCHGYVLNSYRQQLDTAYQRKKYVTASLLNLPSCKLDIKLNSDGNLKLILVFIFEFYGRYWYLLNGWGEKYFPHLCIVASH